MIVRGRYYYSVFVCDNIIFGVCVSVLFDVSAAFIPGGGNSLLQRVQARYHHQEKWRRGKNRASI